MTEIVIVASGSRGDVQPYIALGKGLKERGYHIRLLTSNDFEALVTDSGLAFDSIGESVEERLKSEEWRETLDGGNFLKILSGMQREMKERAVTLAERMPALIKGSNLVITGMGGMTGVFSIAEKFNIPFIETHVFPFTPTSEFPSPLVPKLPKALRKLSFHITRQMFWQNFKVSDTITRQKIGLPKGSFWGPYRSLEKKGVPVLYGYSEYVLPRPSDWGKNHHVTGYWFLDTATDWTPPCDLVQFLDKGETPVYIGFGSMGSRNPEEAGEIALEALALSGQRGVLASGWGGLKPTDLPHTVHMISSIPHSWLFERVKTVVHHGGAGTTAAGLRAGVPSVIIPFMGDQPFWGKRVADLGVGTQPILRKKLTAKQLAQAISETISNTSMIRRADELGQKIRSEDGISNAVNLIERFIKSSLVK